MTASIYYIPYDSKLRSQKIVLQEQALHWWQLEVQQHPPAVYYPHQQHHQ